MFGHAFDDFIMKFLFVKKKMRVVYCDRQRAEKANHCLTIVLRRTLASKWKHL